MQSRNESQTKWSDEAVEGAHDTRVVEPQDCQSERVQRENGKIQVHTLKMQLQSTQTEIKDDKKKKKKRSN